MGQMVIYIINNTHTHTHFQNSGITGPDQNWFHDIKRILLSAIPECIYEDFVVLDCYWANGAAKFKCTLSTREFG